MESWGEQGVGKVAEVMGRWSVAGMKQAKYSSGREEVVKDGVD